MIGLCKSETLAMAKHGGVGNQLKGKIHGYARVRDSTNQTTILRFLNNLSAKKTLSNVLDDSN